MFDMVIRAAVSHRVLGTAKLACRDRGVLICTDTPFVLYFIKQTLLATIIIIIISYIYKCIFMYTQYIEHKRSFVRFKLK